MKADGTLWSWGSYASQFAAPATTLLGGFAQGAVRYVAEDTYYENLIGYNTTAPKISCGLL